MRKIFSVLTISFLMCRFSFSQTEINTGKPIAEIFTNFHYDLNDTSLTTGFGLNRAYLGYKYVPDKNFSATLIVNIGSPEELPVGAAHRRYAYFREASISWTNDKLNISMGITGTRLFSYQQKFWGKRYVANTYQSINGYGFVADLGLAVDYIFNDIFRADFTLMNGEGYSELQLDNSVKATAGLIITPAEQFAFRLYGDITRPHGIFQYTMIGFAGFKNDQITFGAEATYKSNLDLINGHHAWGFSGTGSVNIAPKTEIFIRYDYSSSATTPGDIYQWNYLLDGSFEIFGLQYTFSQNVKMALNYQGRNPYYPSLQVTDAIYLNAVFRF